MRDLTSEAGRTICQARRLGSSETLIRRPNQNEKNVTCTSFNSAQGSIFVRAATFFHAQLVRFLPVNVTCD